MLMEAKYKNKYSVSSIRLQNWDYASNAAYFVTICTHDRINYFGEITGGEMDLSNVGVLADVLWWEIVHHTRYVELDAFVVMPNHVHGIIILNKPMDISSSNRDGDNGRTVACNDSTIITTANDFNKQMSVISPKPESLPTIIRSYKSAVTYHCNRLGFSFKWQPKYYDHIIRDGVAFERIRNYILNNPANWKDDKFF